jgi:hypothetical protein
MLVYQRITNNDDSNTIYYPIIIPEMVNLIDDKNGIIM